MNRDKKITEGLEILRTRFRASISEGKVYTRLEGPRAWSLNSFGEIGIDQTITERGYQVDFTPAEFEYFLEVMCELGERIEYPLQPPYMYDSGSKIDKVATSIIQADLEERRIRESHPALKKAWDHYQNLKILIKNPK